MKWYSWLMTHWGLILTGLVLTASVLNLLTSHFGESNPRAKKVLLFLVDLLAIVISNGSTDGPGRLGGLYRLKLPILQTSPQSKVKTRAGSVIERVGLIFAVLLVAGCSSSGLRQTLVTASAGVKEVRVVVVPKTCDYVESKCKVSPCAALERCHRVEKGMAMGARIWLNNAKELNLLIPDKD